MKKYLLPVIAILLSVSSITYAASLSGAMSRDANRQSMQTANTFVTGDATGTPITSPKVISSVEIPLVTPDNAVQLVLTCSAAVRIYETTGSSSYFVIPANNGFTLSVLEATNVYLIRDSGDATCSFMYTII